MMTLEVRNVNRALGLGLALLRSHGVPEQSRGGDVLALPQPMTTVYNRPWERVLFDPIRDANPFFHLMESVWMLAGSSDARWLDTWVKDFSARYAEENGHIHGAYGRRWREHFQIDQLLKVGDMLYQDPTTRRAVIAMWDPEVDLGADKKDLCCNTHIYWRARQDHMDKVWDLDMTVCCRSNDMIWGAYGANAVHMSILHEVMAGLAGMRQGIYRQVSNNMHAYVEVMNRLGNATRPPEDPYLGQVTAWPMLRHDVDNPHWREAHRGEAMQVLTDCERVVAGCHHGFSSLWVTHVVLPVMRVHEMWRRDRRHEAVQDCSHIAAEDWRRACREWLERRIKQ